MAEIGIEGYPAWVALVGSPNSGKTTLFNALTGSRQKVANYPGVTVERKEGVAKTPSGKTIRILDLPGAYSLSPNTLDEEITRNILSEALPGESIPQLLVAVVDATNLSRHLNLVLEIKSLNIPIILALNMMDLAKKRSLHLDFKVLSEELGIPVFPIVAVKRQGLKELLKKVENYLQTNPGEKVALKSLPKKSQENLSEKEKQDLVKKRLKQVDEILKKAQIHDLKPALWTDRIDRVVLHPIWGTFLLFGILAVVFQAVFTWAAYPMGWIESGFQWLSLQVQNILSPGLLQSFMVDGLISGVGSVLVFLPQILLLFFFILFLEDSGYMSRAAFLMDRHMRRVGLHGRAFLPLLSSFACAIPGIMATRTIEHRRDRLLTILIAPLMACSARIPVYTLLISAFIPNRSLWGPFKLQGLVMLGLYVFGALIAFVVAGILRKWVVKGSSPALFLELPTYKWPHFRNLLWGMWERGRLFLRRAGTVILLAVILIWFLVTFPQAPQDLPQNTNPLTYSFAGKMGKLIEPILQPIGFDWTIGIGLITALVAREVMVGTLATLYSIDASAQTSVQTLSTLLQNKWSLATGLSLLVFFIFAMQCLSTLVVAKRETNSWRWPLFMFSYMTGLAYLASLVTFQITQWVMG